VHFTDAYTGVAVGSRGLILRTTDGGFTWKVQPSGVSFVLRGVSFSNAITGWAVGTGGLLRTTTGGDPGTVAVSAASLTAPVAAGSLASLVGAQLAMSTAEADPRLPVTTLGGISLRLHHSLGRSYLVPLLYVSPGQVNFQVPPEASTGNATLEIVNAPSLMPQITVAVRTVAPGLFAFADGKSASYGIRIEPDGRQTVLGQARSCWTSVRSTWSLTRRESAIALLLIMSKPRSEESTFWLPTRGLRATRYRAWTKSTFF
jgi:hypothetical protein